MKLVVQIPCGTQLSLDEGRLVLGRSTPDPSLNDPHLAKSQLLLEVVAGREGIVTLTNTAHNCAPAPPYLACSALFAAALICQASRVHCSQHHHHHPVPALLTTLPAFLHD